MLSSRQVWMGLLIAFSWASASHASEAMLRRFFIDVDTLRADFTQRVTDESGMILESSSGVFSLSRPSKFRWDYKSPDQGSNPSVGADSIRGMQIVSDGELITFYDPDLETASLRSFEQAVEQVPTMALVQSGEQLDTLFGIVDYGLTDGLSWIALKPKDKDAGYQELMLGFDAGDLNTIVLTDGLGNETRLILTNLRINQTLPSSTFNLALSDDVDVVR